MSWATCAVSELSRRVFVGRRLSSLSSPLRVSLLLFSVPFSSSESVSYVSSIVLVELESLPSVTSGNLREVLDSLIHLTSGVFGLDSDVSK